MSVRDSGPDSRWSPRAQLLWAHYSRDDLLTWLADPAHVAEAAEILATWPAYQPVAFHFWWSGPPVPAMLVRTADVLRVWRQQGLLTLSVLGDHVRGYEVVSASAQGLVREHLDEVARRQRMTPGRLYPSVLDEPGVRSLPTTATAEVGSQRDAGSDAPIHGRGSPSGD